MAVSSEHKDVKELRRLLATLGRLFHLRQAMLLFFNTGDGPMALSPALQQALADLNTAIDNESTEIAGMAQALIDKINAGNGIDEAELLTALTGIKTRVEGISTTLPTLPTE